MEHLRPDDPEQIGPYRTLARLDADGDADGYGHGYGYGHGHGYGARRPLPERRYVARSADGTRTALVITPRPGTDGPDPIRWAIEAEGARRLGLPGFARVTETGGTAAAPWYAQPYLPVLPLPAALAAHGGPLAEPVVRCLGAALADALGAAHAEGVTHAGLAPAAVLLGAEGPLLTGYGAVRAAAPDGERRTDAPGLDPGCLAPEQALGGRPRPLGDVFALGAVLSYASTGYTVPEREELPAGLRSLVTACLSRDPAKRPSAKEIRAELGVSGRESAHGSLDSPATTLSLAAMDGSVAPTPTVLDGSVAPTPTVLDGSVAPTPTTLDGPVAPTPTTLDGPGSAPFPLPARLIAHLVRQSTQLLAVELPTPAAPATATALD